MASIEAVITAGSRAAILSQSMHQAGHHQAGHDRGGAHAARSATAVLLNCFPIGCTDYVYII